MYDFVKSDAGRAKHKPSETLDCTVRSLSLARGMSYLKAHKLLNKKGRKDNSRFDFDAFMKDQYWAKRIDFLFKRGQRRLNIKEFCNNYNTGIWIVRISGHVFTVKNGIRYDIKDDRLNERVIHAWRII